MALIATVSAPAPAQEIPPQQVVEHFHEALLATMKEADSLGVGGRFDRLAPAIDRAFDLAKMIKVATGSAWTAAGADQQDALTRAFRRLSIGTYAAQFDGWSGQRFETTEVRPGPQETRLVATRIVKQGATEAALTYVVRATDEEWRIVDVLLDGSISQLAVRRSEYRRILKDDGVEGLIGVLTDKATDLGAP